MLKKYNKIKFPQNVFLISSYFETGEVEELSHGLFQDKNEDILQAQKHFSNLLFRHLYKTPAKLLEVGVGSGQIHEKLVDKGFECTGISSDEALIEMIESNNKNLNLICSRFEDLDADIGKNDYDVILFRESTEEIDSDDLFSKADELLVVNGRILIADTFSKGKKPFHDIEDFLSAAQEHGFNLIQEKDLSKEAALTLDYRLRILEKHKDRICQELELSEKKFNDLMDMLHKHKKRYDNDKFSYFFLEFKKELKKQSSDSSKKQIKNLKRQDPVNVSNDTRSDKEHSGQTGIKKKNRALVLSSLPLTHVGGIEKVNLQIVNLLKTSGWEVDTRSYYDMDVNRLKRGVERSDMFTYDYFVLAGTYDWRSYDLVITNNTVGGACYSTENTKVIAFSHGVHIAGINMLPEKNPGHDYSREIHSSIEKAGYCSKDKVIAVSRKVQQELKEYFDIESLVINNGFDFDLFSPSSDKFDLRKEYNIPEDAMVALYAGRWSLQEKRPDITLDLAKAFPEITWIFATNESIPESEKMKNVIVIKDVSYDKMPALYAAVNFTVQLSLYEGFSNFAIESIASKTPMISTRTGIIDEVYSGIELEDLLIEQSISRKVILEGAAEKVKLLLNSYSHYKNASEALYAKAKPRFSLETWKKQIRDVLGIKAPESLEVTKKPQEDKAIKKVILHIGSSKTGSSALQSFFLDHQSVLEESGFYYPSHATDVNKMSSGNGLEIVAIAEQSGLEEAKKRVDEIISNSPQEHIIISTEYFYPYPDLVHALFPEATIIVYFREPTARLESEYNQSIKRAYQTNHHLDALKDILDGEEDAIYSGMILEKWMKLYGTENIILRPYEKEQFKGGSIFSDFITSIGITWSEKFKLPKSRVNVSYTRDAQEFKLLLNRITVQRDDETEKMIDQALQAYSQILYDKGEPKYPLLSKEERAKLMAHYEPSNSFIAKKLLNREDGKLFYTLDSASKLPDYPGLTVDRIEELARYIAAEYPKSTPAIIQNIKNGLKSDKEEVKNAADTLSPLLSIFEK